MRQVDDALKKYPQESVILGDGFSRERALLLFSFPKMCLVSSCVITFCISELICRDFNISAVLMESVSFWDIRKLRQSW